MDTKTFRFSASSVKSLIQCGFKFKYDKIDKIKPDIETGHARWLGKVVHASIYSAVGRLRTEEGFKKWTKTSDKASLPAAAFTFETLWNEGKGADPYYEELYTLEVNSTKPTGRFRSKKADKLLSSTDQKVLEEGWHDMARSMVVNGVKVISDMKILELEHAVSFEFLDHEFSGYLDLLIEDEDGRIAYGDFKTTWAKPSAKDMAKDLQFILYSHALKQTMGLDYYPKGYYIHLRSGAKVEFEMSDQIFDDAVKKVTKAFKGLQNNAFTSDYNGPLCSYCDFQKLCYGEMLPT